MRKVRRKAHTLCAFLLCVLLLPTTFAIADDGSYDEYGVWWINDYSDRAGYDSVAYCDDEAVEFYTKMNTEGYDRDFLQTDDGATENHFERAAKGGDAYYYSDNIDFFYFVGHGNVRQMIFNEDNDGDTYHTEMVRADDSSTNEPAWGGNDLEWAFLHCCNALHSSYYTNWQNSFEGLHGICGFDTTTHARSDGALGEWFAYYLTDGGLDIHDAWREATEKTVLADRDAAIYRARVRYEDNSYFDYGDEYIDDMEDDYTLAGIYLQSYLYSEWDCEWDGEF